MDPKLEQLLAQLVHQRVADLYLLPTASDYRVLINLNGQRQALEVIPTVVANRWISHLKYRANMSVTEHRRPQAGALKLKVGQRIVDVRLSTVGDFRDRESMVVRFIYRLASQQYSLLIPAQWDELVRTTKVRGLILFAGPTGSGKTTTMYQLARELKDQVVMTIEDPVEIEEPAFLQLQVNELAGMGYQELIKVGLRHRPQVFIIGEIRDHQTATMAIQASLSGHLVMATVHARSARGVIARLRQLHIDEYEIEQSLSGIAYQRLLPTVDGQMAVLFDLLTGRENWQTVENQNGGKNGQQWQANLEKLVAAGKILPETQQQFQFG